MVEKKTLKDRISKLFDFKSDNKEYEFYIPSDEKKEERGDLDLGQSQNTGECKTSLKLDENIKYIKKRLNSEINKDIVIRKVKANGEFPFVIIYIDGMADMKSINDFILRPIMESDYSKIQSKKELAKELPNFVAVASITKEEVLDNAISRIFIGDCMVLCDGVGYVLVCETKGYDKRGVEMPKTEGAIKGSYEGFCENLKSNVALIRRIIRHPALTSEYITYGDISQNMCAVMYLNGVTNPAVVDEVKRRISSLKGDFIHGSGMLEQFIEDAPYCIFPTVMSTERPDRTAANINEGRVAIIADGTPFALIVPVTVSSMLSTNEDITLRWQYGTLIRVIRVISLIVSMVMTAIYIGIVNFHRELISTDILIAIARSRENVPFPTFIEVLMMEISFELIREAGVRAPGVLGGTVGMVGALILGQAAVEANLVSPVLIIVIAFTGISSFVLPDFSIVFAARIIRLFLIACAALMGFMGVALGIVIVLSFAASRKSFGIPVILGMGVPRTTSRVNMSHRVPIYRYEERPDEVNAVNRTNQPRISRWWTKKKPKYGRKKK